VHASGGFVGGSAAIVVDGATGRTLWALNEHAPRHPASVTKVMTLYLLFEQMEKGKISLDDEIKVSSHAAAQAPTKLGIAPGHSVRVDDAIKAIVTKSANDIAVAIAEHIGGTESDFAELMTRKAHSLGMAHTTYRNASGLPNSEQITTAYDLAVLGRAVQARFPRYYHYFSIHNFAFRGQTIPNHNHLMDRVEGMDGIKTGYTAASGFNLLSSVKRDGHYIVSVVMGGKSARSRDAYMEQLIEDNIDKAGPHRAGAFVADADEDDKPVAKAEDERPAPVARAEARPAPEPVRPRVDPTQLQLAAVVPDSRPRPAFVSAAPQPPRAAAEKAPATANTHAAAANAHAPTASDGSTGHNASGGVTPSALRWQAGPQAKVAARVTGKPEAAPVKEAREKDEGVSIHAKHLPTAKPAVSGWSIQIGATDDAQKAEDLLSKARSQRGAQLGAAKPYTEAVHKGRETIYRARFAGLEESRAEAACKALKRTGFSCFATRN
jgi:D-alanyl-D-alanine carboxypeptidase